MMWTAALLVALLVTGTSVALGALAASAAGAVPSALRPLAVAIGYVALVAAVAEIGSAPIAFYSGFLLESRYGLSRQRLGSWLRDQIKSFLLSVLLGGAAAGLI